MQTRQRPTCGTSRPLQPKGFGDYANRLFRGPAANSLTRICSRGYGLKGMLQSALDSGMTQVAISPVALSELS
jgi:hypothetical protein